MHQSIEGPLTLLMTLLWGHKPLLIWITALLQKIHVDVKNGVLDLGAFVVKTDFPWLWMPIATLVAFGFCGTISPNPPVLAALQSPTPAPVPRIRTRLQDGIQKPKLHTDDIVKYHIPRALLTVADHTEPTCFSEATKHLEWRDAMTEKINALLRNHTWSLVPSSPSQNLIGCKWVFRIKRHSDGYIERYKARLVVKGFHQRPGIDYDETFNPIVKPATIRTILSLAISHGWSLRQLDVKNVFLHGFLQKDVYTAQPPGFIDATHPSYVASSTKYSMASNNHLVLGSIASVLSLSLWALHGA
ncbi:hypothetical protein L3X38_015829 [Prunus dulcis]|uniref:Reverse transcriptase Ty1/copia-type domain-containing protein n=1 Tax=Prunus dulcis TaxID=3755 RepID=A0AAD4Z8K1_PRUDU|nr:hypothetical protein L3X38_015829 [Prunus dulcis]